MPFHTIHILKLKIYRNYYLFIFLNYVPSDQISDFESYGKSFQTSGLN